MVQVGALLFIEKLVNIDITPDSLARYSSMPAFWVILTLIVIIFFLPAVIEIWTTGAPFRLLLGSPRHKFRRFILFLKKRNRKPPICHKTDDEIIISEFNETQFDYDNHYQDLFTCKWFYNDPINPTDSVSIKIVGGDCIYIKGRLYEIPEHAYGLKIFDIILEKSPSNTLYIDVTKGKIIPKMLQQMYQIATNKTVVIVHKDKESEIMEVARLINVATGTNLKVEFRNYEKHNIIYKRQ